MKYDRDYFHKELLMLQNLKFNEYQDKTDFDILIDKLNSEEIYTYYDVDWKAFAYQLVNYEDFWDENLNSFCEIIEDKNIELISSRIVDREVKIKLLLFLQRNVQDIWRGCRNSDYLEKECARLISKEIEESKRDQYHGIFASMPRPDYRAMLASESLFYEKTPMKQWIESHFTEAPKLKESTFELSPQVNEILSQFADECTDSSNPCPTKRVIDEAIELYLSYKATGEYKSDIWEYINNIYDKLKKEVNNLYWRRTPAYQVMAVLYVLLNIQEHLSISDKSFISNIANVVFKRDNFSCTKEMADAAVQRIKGENVDNVEEMLPETALTQISQMTTDLQKTSPNVTVNINLVKGDQVAHKDANIDKNLGTIICTE